MAPGETYTYTALRLFSPAGEYMAQASYEDETGVWRLLGDSVLFAVQPADRPPRTSALQFGVHWHTTWQKDEDDRQLELAASASVEILRIGASWWLMEPEGKGQWDTVWYLPELARVIDRANALGMEVYLPLAQWIPMPSY